MAKPIWISLVAEVTVQNFFGIDLRQWAFRNLIEAKQIPNWDVIFAIGFSKSGNGGTRGSLRKFSCV